MNSGETGTLLQRIAPSRRAYTVVPHNTNPLPIVPKGIYVGTGGTVTLRPVDADQDVVYTNLADGSYIAVQASHIRDTGTTAQNLVAEA